VLTEPLSLDQWKIRGAVDVPFGWDIHVRMHNRLLSTARSKSNSFFVPRNQQPISFSEASPFHDTWYIAHPVLFLLVYASFCRHPEPCYATAPRPPSCVITPPALPLSLPPPATLIVNHLLYATVVPLLGIPSCTFLCAGQPCQHIPSEAA
jgi:hypothetical protein